MTDLIGKITFWERVTPSGHCENCHWWRQPPYMDPSIEAAQCVGPHIRYLSDPPKDGLSYGDYEGAGAWCWTGPRYGCIHWTPKK